MGGANGLLFIFCVVLGIIYLVYLLARREPEPIANKARPTKRGQLSPGTTLISVLLGSVVFAWLLQQLDHSSNPLDMVVGLFRAINMELLIFIGLVVGIPLYLKYRKQKKVTDAATLALTPEHPFKVKVTVAPLEKSSFGLDYVRGRKLTHQMEIDVLISQKDWKRIKDAGVYDASLFKYPDTTSTHSGTMTDFPVSHLDGGRKKYAGFYNITDAELAKEKLIENLYNLKDTISLHKEGKRSEALEI